MTQKKDFLTGLRNAIFNEPESEVPNSTEETGAAPPPPPPPPAANMSPMPVFTTAMVGQIDPEKYQKLQTAMYPTSGPLSSFLLALQAMRGVILDEGTAFRAVIATLAAQGVSVDQIFSEITAMDGRVTQEVTRFGEKRKIDTQTGVTDKEKRVAELNQQIDTLTREREKLSNEAMHTQAEIAQKNSNFEAAIAALRTEFGDIRRKLEMYTTNVAVSGGKK